jgi:Ca-activated chloride channel homolog
MAKIRRVLQVGSALILAAAVVPAHADKKDRERDKPPRKDVAPPAAPSPAAYDFEMEAIDGDFGATPGGAKDISFFRDRVKDGEIPHPNVFTPEGLFSEHDLPLVTGKPCKQLFCVNGEAMEATLMVQPEVRYLAQLGFSSGLKQGEWKREPLNLVAVIDKSGSMSGQPLDLVKESLIQVVSQLNKDDQIGIVLYGDRVHGYMEPTLISDKKALIKQIQGIESAGSTNMEAGLEAGFEMARNSQKKFKGMTRVMLFTDERPNTGRTDADSFMGMATAASKDGIGMTTIGVGVQFGAELATKISSVRGGNLFFFPDVQKMKQVFTDEFDTMMTELAYELELVITPEKGMKIAGVYGIPGSVLEWTEDGSIKLHVQTIFLSRKKGAIYVAFGNDGKDNLPEAKVAVGKWVGSVAVSYLERGKDKRASASVNLTRIEKDKASTGLTRGLILVEEATTLKAAAAAHHEKNDQERAYQLVHALASTLRQTDDADLANERTMVADLERTLAKLSGHQGEPDPHAGKPDQVTGLPPQNLAR